MALKTTKENISALREAIPVSQLPQTFLDAVLVTRSLGIGYLWIDSLCIVQDDMDDWEQESGRMASVYQNAVITLAATHSSDSTGGLFTPFNHKPYHWSSDDGCSKTIRSEDTNIWDAVEIKSSPQLRRYFTLYPSDDIRDTQQKHPADLVNTGYPLLTRAWVFQERLLSPRVVHFTTTQLAWECRCELWTESHLFTLDDHGGDGFPAAFTESYEPSPPQHDFFHTIAKYDFAKTRGRFIDLAHEKIWPQPRRNRVEMMLERLNLLPQEPKRPPTPPSRTAILETWSFLVQEYARLSLTHETDRLPALSGIASAVHSMLNANGTYLAGIWSSQLPQALCWVPSSPPATIRKPAT
ncbi:hypothetical protein OQA88_10523, partial [Cercophora sp. LCS_1]